MGIAVSWYSSDGALVDLVPSRGGGQKRATVREAREHKLVPRFSTVAEYKSSYYLTEWRVNTAIETALANPDKSLDEIKEILQDGGDTSKNKGSEIHRSLELYFTENRSVLYPQLCESINEGVVLQFDAVLPEKRIITKWFGGTADLVGLKHGTFSVGDFKTTKNLDKIRGPYDKWLIQLAAYSWGLRVSGELKSPNTANFIIAIDQNTLDWKRFDIDDDDIKRAEKEWVAMLYAWHVSNKLNPEGLKEYL